MRIRANYGIIGPTQTQTATSTGRIYSSVDQQFASQNYTWPNAYADFVITPAVGGVSYWKWSVNGTLVITTPGEYTLQVTSPFTKVAKMWGSGGAPCSAGSTSWGAGGAGGAAVGTMSFVPGTTYIIRVPAAGNNTAGSAPALAYGAGISGGVYSIGTAGSGGGYAGMFLTSVSQANALLMAGGGGGGASDRSDGLGGRLGLAGGGTTGQAVVDFQAQSGTQSAGGAAGGSGSPTSGSALQGGAGNGGGAGGGGGYFGGGGGGRQSTDGGYGGGGGSGYYNPSYITAATIYTGSGTTPGNSGDADRPTNAGNSALAGSAASNGAFVIKV